MNGSIAASAISASPDSAAVIDDAILSIAPGCADAIQRATTGDDVGATEDIPAEGPGGTGAPSNVQPPPFGGGGGSGGFFSPEAQVQICDNGRQHAIRFSRVDRFLGNHPGSFIGSCQITPVTSR